MAGRMIIVAEATANTGHEDAVRAALRTCSAPSRDEPGNVLYQPLEGEAPGTFLVYEIWQDKDAFDFHRETRTSRRWSTRSDRSAARSPFA